MPGLGVRLRPELVIAFARNGRSIRPEYALGQGRLHRLRDGRIAVALQRPWADGTTHLVFTPLELLERLAPLVPRPRINLLLYLWVRASSFVTG